MRYSVTEPTACTTTPTSAAAKVNDARGHFAFRRRRDHGRIQGVSTCAVADKALAIWSSEAPGENQ